ncbi:MAG TPA: hypothetical protein VK468_06800 [Pyrinomonadaceae bacterium]|nr:hypothetical protein [Pyrinomonadaceae bacterium]
MNRLRSIIAIAAFSLLVLALPSIASAQYRDRDDDYYGNGRNNNGRNGNNGYYGDIRGTLDSLKDKARNLETRSDRIDDRRDDRNNGRYGNSYGNLEQLTDRFRDATKDLANAYGRGRNLNGSADEARRVLDIGSQIDQEMSQSRSNRGVQNQWNQIRNDLRTVANTYNMNYNGNGNSNRNRNNGNWRNRFPLPF